MTIHTPGTSIIHAVAAFVAVLLTAGSAAAQPDIRPSGIYLCTVEQKAGIAEEQLEGSDRPAAFIDRRVTRFRLRVTPPAKHAAPNARFKIEEMPYAGPQRDPQKWQTKNAVLHSAYVGDGWSFSSQTEQAFLRLDIASTESGWLFFHHAGFEHPDVDNVKLSVRSGTCAPEK